MRFKIASLLLLFAVSTFGQSLPNVVAYPQEVTGWTFSGNVSPQGCTGTACQYDLPTNTGSDSGLSYNHTQGSVWEPQLDELFQLQSNGVGSYANLLFSLPSTTTYVIAVDVKCTQGPAHGTGTTVWPVLNIVLNGANQPICKYPNGVAITQTTALTVNNGGFGLHEYAETCPITIFGGNNTVGIQIVGGTGFGGSFVARNLIIYPSASGVKGNVGCQNRSGWHNTTLTGSDLQALNTAARSFVNANCGSVSRQYINLRNGALSASGCSGFVCGLLELD